MNYVALVLLQVAGLVATAIVYHKLSGAVASRHKEAIALADNTFKQVEALGSLYVELGLRHALPPTRAWAASPDFLRNVMAYTLSQCPRTVVECSSGISTIVLARCMEILGEGHVYSLEHDAEFAQKTRSLLRDHGLERFATVCDAPLVEVTLSGWSGQWYSHDILSDDIAIDLLVIDGPPQFVAKLARYPAVPCLHQHFGKAATVFLDDADRDDERAAVQRWLDEYPALKLIEVPLCEKGCAALKKG